MAYTNAQLVRREVGDAGIFQTRYFSGDGATKRFYLPPAILAGSYAIYIADVLKTETTDYTLDIETGELVFIAAPGAAVDNILAKVKIAELSDGDITEALRQRGLTSSDTADTGFVPGVLLAGADLADWLAAKFAFGYDSNIDGQHLYRSQRAAAWEKIAISLRDKARKYGGIQSIQVIRIDGYNRDEVSSRDVNQNARNPRQRYYYVDRVDLYP